MITADYIPGVTRPSRMTDSEITRELRNGDTTQERRAQLLDHLEWLKEYRQKAAEDVPEISTYTDTGLKTGPHPPATCRTAVLRPR